MVDIQTFSVMIPVLLFCDRGHLEKRKHIVVSTLGYIHNLKSEIEANTEWLDLRTQMQRYLFLSELHSMYEHELKQILESLGKGTIESDEQKQ